MGVYLTVALECSTRNDSHRAFYDLSSSDEWEEMCVVAIGEQEVQALRSRGFRDLLLAIGLQSPNEQVNNTIVSIWSMDEEVKWLLKKGGGLISSVLIFHSKVHPPNT